MTITKSQSKDLLIESQIKLNKLLEAAKHILFHLDNRPGLRNNFELLTEDERSALRKAIREAGDL